VATQETNTTQLGKRSRNKAENRRGILESAKSLFSKHTLQEVTVERITKSSGVSKGTFFNYFPNKESVLQEFGAFLLRTLADKLQESSPEDCPLQDRLRVAILTSVEEMGLNRQIARNILASFLDGGSSSPAFESESARFRESLEGLISRSQERGEIARVSSPSEEPALLLQQILLGAFALWAVRPSLILDEQLDRACEFIWRGLSAVVPHEEGRPPESSAHQLPVPKPSSKAYDAFPWLDPPKR